MNNLHNLNKPEASRSHRGCLYLSWWKIPWSIYPPELAFGELSPAVRWSGLCDLGHRWSGEVNQHSSNKSDIYCTSPFRILSNINASHTFISGVIISWVRFKQIISSSELKGLKENTHTHTHSQSPAWQGSQLILRSTLSWVTGSFKLFGGWINFHGSCVDPNIHKVLKCDMYDHGFYHAGGAPDICRGTVTSSHQHLQWTILPSLDVICEMFVLQGESK